VAEELAPGARQILGTENPVLAATKVRFFDCSRTIDPLSLLDRQKLEKSLGAVYVSASAAMGSEELNPGH
jgi:hypothetical protein